MAEQKEKGNVQAKIRKDHMELSFGPRWTYISCVRGFVAHFFAIGLEDKIHAERISLAVSELLENAVKYSAGTDTTGLDADGAFDLALDHIRSRASSA